MKKRLDETVQQMRRRLIGSFLATARKDASLSQKDVARYLAYSTPQFVSNWERGVSLPPKEKFPDIAKLFHLTPKILIDVYDELMRAEAKMETDQLINLFRRRAG